VAHPNPNHIERCRRCGFPDSMGYEQAYRHQEEERDKFETLRRRAHQMIAKGMSPREVTKEVLFCLGVDLREVASEAVHMRLPYMMAPSYQDQDPVEITRRELHPEWNFTRGSSGN